MLMKPSQNIDFGQCIGLIEEKSDIGREEHPFTESSMFQIAQNRVDGVTEGRPLNVFGCKRLGMQGVVSSAIFLATTQ